MTGRYARHGAIPGWQPEKLMLARVTVLGVGALGNEVARLLGMAGVGELLLCDPDVVSVSNLSRCVLFRPADVGRLKVAAARDMLAELAPDTTVVTRAAPLDAGIGLADLRDAALVVGCLDSVAARVLLAQRCALAGAGWLDGGTHAWGGEVRRFARDGACYGCLAGASGRSTLDDPLGCGSWTAPVQRGASAPVAAMVGGWLAATAVRIMCGLPAGPDLVAIDAASGGQAATLGRDASCPLHSAIPPELVLLTALTSRTRVDEALALAAPDEDIMTWRGFAPRPDAAGGGRRPADLAMFGPAARTATFLRGADSAARLADLGIPPREILPVVNRATAQVSRYIELAAEEPEKEGTF